MAAIFNGDTGIEIDVVTGAPRIRGDFSNAIVGSRAMFQSKVIDGVTSFQILPNGAGAYSQFAAIGGSDPNNASYLMVSTGNSGTANVSADKAGTGAYLPMAFYTGGLERMRVDTTGNVLVNTATYRGRITAEDAGSSTANVPIGVNVSSAAGVGSCYVLASYRGGTFVGSISNTSTATAYNTSSDYRLKENVADLNGSGAFIDGLRPRSWTWKLDGSAGAGFIAHELQAISPSSVVGVKDATDAEGNPIYQAVEYGSAEVVANLVAEVQALRKRVAALEAK